MAPQADDGPVKVPPSLTVGLLNTPRLIKSVARASARAVPQRNDLPDFWRGPAKPAG